MSSYIWDVSNPNTPDFELTPQSQLTSINFNLKDTSLVGAGQYNGQFAYFDMRKGSTPVEASPIEHSHRYACTHAGLRDQCYLLFRSTLCFVTAALDVCSSWHASLSCKRTAVWVCPHKAAFL